MTARPDARVVSAAISDVPGVQTLLVDLATRTVRVTGSADPAAVSAAVTATTGVSATESQPGDFPGESTRAPPRLFIPTPHQPPPRSTPMLSETAPNFTALTTFTVTGTSCARCQVAVTEEISAIEGVESVDVDPATGTVTVTADRPVDRADVAAAVDEAGCVLVP